MKSNSPGLQRPSFGPQKRTYRPKWAPSTFQPKREEEDFNQFGNRLRAIRPQDGQAHLQRSDFWVEENSSFYSIPEVGRGHKLSQKELLAAENGHFWEQPSGQKKNSKINNQKIGGFSQGYRMNKAWNQESEQDFAANQRILEELGQPQDSAILEEKFNNAYKSNIKGRMRRDGMALQLQTSPENSPEGTLNKNEGQQIQRRHHPEDRARTRNQHQELFADPDDEEPIANFITRPISKKEPPVHGYGPSGSEIGLNQGTQLLEPRWKKASVNNKILLPMEGSDLEEEKIYHRNRSNSSQRGSIDHNQFNHSSLSSGYVIRYIPRSLPENSKDALKNHLMASRVEENHYPSNILFNTQKCWSGSSKEAQGSK